jgi:hypothetical protein
MVYYTILQPIPGVHEEHETKPDSRPKCSMLEAGQKTRLLVLITAPIILSEYL